MTDLSKTSGTSPPGVPAGQPINSTKYARDKAKRIAAGTLAEWVAKQDKHSARYRTKAKAERDAQWLTDHPGFTLEDRDRAGAARRRKGLNLIRRPRRARLYSINCAMPSDFDGGE